MTNEITITVKTNPKFKPWRAAYLVSVFVGLIGIGAVLDSTAMQWAGFVMSFIVVAGITAAINKRDTDLTIQEARNLLDEIERDSQ